MNTYLFSVRLISILIIQSTSNICLKLKEINILCSRSTYCLLYLLYTRDILLYVSSCLVNFKKYLLLTSISPEFKLNYKCWQIQILLWCNARQYFSLHYSWYFNVYNFKSLSNELSEDRPEIFLFKFVNWFHEFFCFSVYTFESHSNELWVMMNSDETVAYSGYLALWEA